jgi:hypothetical protein
VRAARSKQFANKGTRIAYPKLLAAGNAIVSNQAEENCLGGSPPSDAGRPAVASGTQKFTIPIVTAGAELGDARILQPRSLMAVNQKLELFSGN